MLETVLGVDLGTTTITALALEPRSDKIVAQHTVANDAESTPPADKARGGPSGIRGGWLTGKAYRRLVGSGNALRRNPVLRRVVTERFALPLQLLPYEEEAAVGAARTAALGASIIF
jgi:sugar (pentulose or hexulose) kinase